MWMWWIERKAGPWIRGRLFFAVTVTSPDDAAGAEEKL
jgi:hypothetical protein